MNKYFFESKYLLVISTIVSQQQRLNPCLDDYCMFWFSYLQGVCMVLQLFKASKKITAHTNWIFTAPYHSAWIPHGQIKGTKANNSLFKIQGSYSKKERKKKIKTWSKQQNYSKKQSHKDKYNMTKCVSLTNASI